MPHALAHIDRNIILLIEREEREGGEKEREREYNTVHNARDTNIAVLVFSL